MTCRAIREVHCGIGVVEAIRIDDIIENGNSSLIKMSMSVDIYIYTVLVEQILECLLRSRVGCRREVPDDYESTLSNLRIIRRVREHVAVEDMYGVMFTL
jgi:hypothetical protein